MSLFRINVEQVNEEKCSTKTPREQCLFTFPQGPFRNCRISTFLHKAYVITYDITYDKHNIWTTNRTIHLVINLLLVNYCAILDMPTMYIVKYHVCWPNTVGGF